MRRETAALAACLACLFVAESVVATTRLPYSGPFLEELRTELFRVESGGAAAPDAVVVLDSDKLANYRGRIERKLRFVLAHVERHEQIDRGRSAKRAQKRAASRDSVLALRAVLERLDALEATSDPARQHELAAEAWMIDYATRSYAEPIGAISIPLHLSNIVFDWSMPSGQRAWQADREAANLVDPATGEFFTSQELAASIRQGVDLSRFDPPRETAFWRAIDDVAALDIAEHYLGGGIPVQQGAPAVFPPDDGAVLQFDGVHLTQSKPKLDATWKSPACLARPPEDQADCEASYKLKFGMETHADPVANALLGGLGYNADLAKHLRNVRVELGDFSYDELERQWIAYFDQQRMHTYIPLGSVLSRDGVGEDGQGGYVEFPAIVAEYKPKEIERIGFWPFSEGVASTSREARGLQLFNIWIANADMKDEENNKLSLRADPARADGTADERLQIYLTQQDVGHSFGLVLPERVDVFPWEAFESSAWSRAFGWIRGRREINYMNLQQSGLEWIATWADSKWMARRIAQLTRSQIESAVALGRFPGGIGPLYVEKLVSRRNQIVRVFDLESEYGQLPFDRHLTTTDGSVVEGEVVQGAFPDETPIRYDGHHADIFGPVLEFMGDGVAELVQVGIGSVDEIDPGTFEITGELRIAPELILKLSRRVYPNPEPAGAFDQHVVQDTLRLGFRIGLGNTGFAQGGWAQTLSLAYPVATRREGLYAQSRLLPVMQWRDVQRGELPERYVLARERMWHVGARVRSSEDIEFTAGADLSHDRVFAWRTVVDHREEAPLVMHDRPRYWNTRARGTARLGVVDIPFVKFSRKSGAWQGRGWRIDPAGLSEADADAVFQQVLQHGDVTGIESIAGGAPQSLDIERRQREGWLGLFVASLTGRTAREQVRLAGDAERPAERQLREDRHFAARWSLFGNGELHEHSTLAWSGTADDQAESTGLRLRWHVDDLNTHSEELDHYYTFLRGLLPERDWIAPDFVASDWEVSGDRYGRWTRMKTSAELHLRPPALEALCLLDEDRFERELAAVLVLGTADVRRLRQRAVSLDAKRRLVERRRLLPAAEGVVRRGDRVLRGLRRHCGASTPEERAGGQAEALFRASPRRGPAFDPRVIGALLSSVDIEGLADQGALLLEGRFHKAFEDEHNLPERRDLVGRVGDPAARIEPTDFRIFPRDGVEQWKQLDWLRERLER